MSIEKSAPKPFRKSASKKPNLVEISGANVKILPMIEAISNFADLFLHLDHHLAWLVQNYGAWTYLIVFLIIFSETGLVVTPFLPGDSLLFALGAVAAIGDLNVSFLILLLASAAVLGNTLNYWIGTLLAPKVFRQERIRFVKPEYLERTKRFYAKYGGKTIVITRFVPIIRTFAPFLAGVGNMNYGRFFLYNLTGGGLWVVCFILGGYFFGNMPLVKKNFSLVIFAIIFISLLPPIFEVIRHRKPL